MLIYVTISVGTEGAYLDGQIQRFERESFNGEHIKVRKKYGSTSFYKHWHNYYEIIYYHGCKGKCILNGKEYAVTDNCLFFLTPIDFHEIVTENIEQSYSVGVGFTEQMLDDSIAGAAVTGARVIYNIPPETESDLERLFQAYKSQGKLRKQKLRSLLGLIMTAVLELGSIIAEPSSELSRPIRHSIEYIHASPSSDITLSSISETVGLSAEYFSRLFHKEVGVTFKKYLTKLRIEYAKRLLEEKKLSVIDIGYECGFNTPSQFVRAFKAQTGMPPSEYGK